MNKITYIIQITNFLSGLLKKKREITMFDYTYQ